MRDMAGRLEEDRASTFMNCWHCSATESLAMWRLYAQNDYCIAIRSTFNTLRSTLPNWTAITFVEYVDWETQEFSDCRQSQCMFRSKRLEFAHEREVRAVYMSALHKGGPAVADHTALEGAVGRSLSALRPSGRARFGEDVVSVVSGGEMIPRGTRVQVVEISGNRVVVSAAPDTESAS